MFDLIAFLVQMMFELQATQKLILESILKNDRHIWLYRGVSYNTDLIL